MGRLILIRHSLPQVSEDEPRDSWTLSPDGIARASTLAVAVAAIKPASLHSSAEEKAKLTAEAITAVTGLTLNVDPDFNEHQRPDEPYSSQEEFTAKVSEALRRPGDLVFGSETMAAAVERFAAALAAAETYSPSGDMAVVSHGTIISAYVASRIEVDPVDIWQSLGMPALICTNWPEPDHIEFRQNIE